MEYSDAKPHRCDTGISLSSGTSRAPNSSGKIVRDNTYYCHDVIILVEDCLFKVPHRYLIQESEFFQQMFQLPAGQTSVVDGLTDEQPLRIEFIKKHEFRQLLKILYPRPSFRPSDDDEVFNLTLDEWTSVLKLSTMWGMDRVRAFTISKMGILLKSNPVTQVILAREYHVDQWLLPGLNMLVKRAEMITTHEVELLGVDSALEIMKIRECAQVNNYGSHVLLDERGYVDVDPTERIKESSVLMKK
ncbi:hypothetical protein BDQ12DRAFT_621719 [Crucibulum laeve]|uniref:BTB domain-containing protein n=1 Tax=Crucibulum laeve TaxID=68775 RepID=A0A5C3MI75_9AGAR|nr:hypothetical protein BDQ12DRAFT_621719 [Crucibulum laeve]